MNGFDRIAVRAAQENLLFSVLLELTYRCNLDCFFCYNDVKKKGVPVSTERYLELLEELRELNVLNLTLSGGEPLAHPAFWTIGRRAAELAFATRVKTNGHAVDADTAKRLREELCPFLVEVSLHGAQAATHDLQTRVAGSFERLMLNLPAMQDAGLTVKLNSTLTTWNIGEIAGMFRIADDLGVRLDLNMTVSPMDDGDRAPLAIAATVEQMRAAFAFLAERNAALPLRGSDPADELPVPASLGGPPKNCGVGSSTLAIDPYGDVLPCVQWRRPVGNIHRQTLREIWVRNGLLDEVRDASVEAARMVRETAEGRKLRSFCPALALQQTGSPVGIYQSARNMAEASEPTEVVDVLPPSEPLAAISARPVAIRTEARPER